MNAGGKNSAELHDFGGDSVGNLDGVGGGWRAMLSSTEGTPLAVTVV